MKLLLIFLCCSLLLAEQGSQQQQLMISQKIAASGTVTLSHTSICGSTASGANCTITTTGTGNGLFVLIQTNNSGSSTISAVTDGGDTFTQVTSGSVVCQGLIADIWYTPSTAGARTVINITTTGGFNYFAVVYETTGTNASAPLDQHATLISSGTNATGPAVTIATASELIITTEIVGGSVSAMAGGFTSDSLQNGGGWGHVVTSATGTFTPTYTSSGSGANCGTIASFKP